MNEIKPTIGFEFTDEYKEAMRKLGECAMALEKLSPVQREQVIRDYMVSIGKGALLQQFIAFMNNRGYPGQWYKHRV